MDLKPKAERGHEQHWVVHNTWWCATPAHEQQPTAVPPVLESDAHNAYVLGQRMQDLWAGQLVQHLRAGQYVQHLWAGQHVQLCVRRSVPPDWQPDAEADSSVQEVKRKVGTSPLASSGSRSERMVEISSTG
eukprot:357838-Chlamydomonas_euryale.AAC.8